MTNWTSYYAAVRAREEAATPAPLTKEQDNDCGVCGSMVDVRGDEVAWREDPICDDCLGEFARQARTDVRVLRERAIALEAALGDAVRSMEAVAAKVPDRGSQRFILAEREHALRALNAPLPPEVKP